MRDRRGWLGAMFVVTVGLAVAYGALVGPACRAGPQPRARPAGGTYSRFEYVEPHMGTRFRIILYAPDETTAKRVSAAAFKRIADLDGIMTDYQPTSELMRLCAKASGEAVPVSPDLFAVLSRSQEIGRKTDGAFDATVGPVVRLWRLSRRTQRLPNPDKL